MELTIDESVLNQYGLTNKNVRLAQIGSGHINRTYLLSNLINNKNYVLQQINANVFVNPTAISNNIKLVANYLNINFPNYLFPAPILAIDGEAMVSRNNEYWRLIPFVEDSVALDTLNSPKQAYEAAKQFGKLSKLLDGFDSSKLAPTIIGFHDLNLRVNQFSEAISLAKPQYAVEAKSEIDKANTYLYILDTYLELKQHPNFPERVMHHDTKISNVLLDEKTFDGICVIDLDTLMPGYFISDLGDMMRTYLCEYSENEKDLTKISIRLPYFTAMIDGYLSEMGNILTSTEKGLILYSGKYIIYMQALRFLTDYLNGSNYYPITYPNQNLDRAKNQFKLLEELVKNETKLQEIIDGCLAKKQFQ